MKILLQVEFTLAEEEIEFLKENNINNDIDLLAYVNKEMNMTELDKQLSKGVALKVIHEEDKLTASQIGLIKNRKKECILECVLDKETRTCEGCRRTLEEIAEAGRQAKCLENEDPMRYIII